MGSKLHRALRCLCSNTGWNYAVFWKLNHRARMMLTWEDAYYDGEDYPRKMCPSNFVGNLQDRHCSHDPLQIALAKMSYHVYFLGEGIVGQVAVTGKHLWVSSDQHVAHPSSPYEHCDGWQTQFSAGIKTIAVVAVVPHGVVQLGSLDKVQIVEDLTTVNHVRNVFFELQGSLADHTPYAISSSMGSSCQSDITTTTLSSGIHHDCLQQLDTSFDKDGIKSWCSGYSSNEKDGYYPCNLLMPGVYQNKMVEMVNKHEGPENSVPEFDVGEGLRIPISGDACVEQLNLENLRATGDINHDLQSSGFGDLAQSSEKRVTLHTNNFSGKNSLCNVVPSAEDSVKEMAYLPSETLDSKACSDERGMSWFDNIQYADMPKDCTNRMDMPFRFCGGYELYEALGPAFQEQHCHFEWDAEKIEFGMSIEMSEVTGNSSLVSANSGTEHLLDAVVANIQKIESSKNEKPCVKSELLLNPENMSEPCMSDMGSISSAGYSFSRDALNSFNSSVASGVHYSKGISSTSCSRGSDTLERPQESTKIQKKRARPGESCRPRPRDRQLIQDRIKELRELVPNGSKCSIDSLLERTIKHMIFMQSITKHAEKLNKCTGSKLMENEPRIGRSSSHEQGSSWAVEVGSNLKVCPIIVENLNMSGQMLIEMLCDECCHFLEIGEAICSMGLIVLKGVTETYGEKTWMRFVVEGQNNRNLHRMDILWSLMQLLQPKTEISDGKL
ncbi:transcription factor EMB1444 isoform X1 [Coffea arabica]|uniref:Transcription factor EMB1444 isoform X1 n=1 Tax=Coffea arabica TaxID=13443 RepID=A0A6P6UXI6_COFAR|nr:transcription factor EMB1444-like isoform X1 [Coffea arabica]